MAKCDVCGNDYERAFTVTMAGRTPTFDSFECAIHARREKQGETAVDSARVGQLVKGGFSCE
jgi:hypothetical protein